MSAALLMMFCMVPSCLDVVIRVVANHMGLELKELEVCVASEVDLRGTLRMDDAVPVGFQKVGIEVRIVPVGDVPGAHLDGLVTMAEQCYIILQTLRRPREIVIKWV